MVGTSDHSRSARGWPRRHPCQAQRAQDMSLLGQRRGRGLPLHEPIHGDPPMAGTRAVGTIPSALPRLETAGHQFAGGRQKGPRGGPANSPYLRRRSIPLVRSVSPLRRRGASGFSYFGSWVINAVPIYERR
jgi:hypothetical protein